MPSTSSSESEYQTRQTASLPPLTLSVLVLLDSINPTLTLNFHDPYTAMHIFGFPILLGPNVHTVRIDDKTLFGISFKDPADAQAWYNDKAEHKHFAALFQYSDTTRHTVWIARTMSWAELQEKLPYGLPPGPGGWIERQEKLPYGLPAGPRGWIGREAIEITSNNPYLSPRSRDQARHQPLESRRRRYFLTRSPTPPSPRVNTVTETSTGRVVDTIGRGVEKLKATREKRTLTPMPPPRVTENVTLD